MRKFVATLFAAVAMLWAVPNVANAQGVQLYSVVVLDSMVLVPPLPAVTIHDGTDNNQVFPVQTWLATTTGTSGATVTLGVRLSRAPPLFGQGPCELMSVF